MRDDDLSTGGVDTLASRSTDHNVDPRTLDLLTELTGNLFKNNVLCSTVVEKPKLYIRDCFLLKSRTEASHALALDTCADACLISSYMIPDNAKHKISTSSIEFFNTANGEAPCLGQIETTLYSEGEKLCQATFQIVSEHVPIIVGMEVLSHYAVIDLPKSIIHWGEGDDKFPIKPLEAGEGESKILLIPGTIDFGTNADMAIYSSSSKRSQQYPSDLPKPNFFQPAPGLPEEGGSVTDEDGTSNTPSETLPAQAALQAIDRFKFLSQQLSADRIKSIQDTHIACGHLPNPTIMDTYTKVEREWLDLFAKHICCCKLYSNTEKIVPRIKPVAAASRPGQTIILDNSFSSGKIAHAIDCFSRLRFLSLNLTGDSTDMVRILMELAQEMMISPANPVKTRLIMDQESKLKSDTVINACKKLGFDPSYIPIGRWEKIGQLDQDSRMMRRVNRSLIAEAEFDPCGLAEILMIKEGEDNLFNQLSAHLNKSDLDDEETTLSRRLLVKEVARQINTSSRVLNTSLCPLQVHFGTLVDIKELPGPEDMDLNPPRPGVSVERWLEQAQTAQRRAEDTIVKLDIESRAKRLDKSTWRKVRPVTDTKDLTPGMTVRVRKKGEDKKESWEHSGEIMSVSHAEKSVQLVLKGTVKPAKYDVSDIRILVEDNVSREVWDEFLHSIHSDMFGLKRKRPIQSEEKEFLLDVYIKEMIDRQEAREEEDDLERNLNPEKTKEQEESSSSSSHPNILFAGYQNPIPWAHILKPIEISEVEDLVLPGIQYHKKLNYFWSPNAPPKAPVVEAPQILKVRSKFPRKLIPNKESNPEPKKDTWVSTPMPEINRIKWTRFHNRIRRTLYIPTKPSTSEFGPDIANLLDDRTTVRWHDQEKAMNDNWRRRGNGKNHRELKGFHWTGSTIFYEILDKELEKKKTDTIPNTVEPKDKEKSKSNALATASKTITPADEGADSVWWGDDESVMAQMRDIALERHVLLSVDEKTKKAKFTTWDDGPLIDLQGSADVIYEAEMKLGADLARTINRLDLAEVLDYTNPVIELLNIEANNGNFKLSAKGDEQVNNIFFRSIKRCTRPSPESPKPDDKHIFGLARRRYWALQGNSFYEYDFKTRSFQGIDESKSTAYYDCFVEFPKLFNENIDDLKGDTRSPTVIIKDWDTIVALGLVHLFNPAGRAEVTGIIDQGTFDLNDTKTKDQSIGLNVIGGRVVYTLKLKAETGLLEKAKVRWAARGDLDREREFISGKTSMTSQEGLFVGLTWLSGAETIKKSDVPQAYLKGKKLTRNIYMRIPDEFKKIDARINHYAVRLDRALYGLTEGGSSWEAQFRDELKTIGYYPLLCDGGILVKMEDTKGNTVVPSHLAIQHTLKDHYSANFLLDVPLPDAKIVGVILSHVDDLIYGGDKRITEEVDKMLQNAWSAESDDIVDGEWGQFLGRLVRKVKDPETGEREIQMSMYQYAQNLTLMPVPEAIAQARKTNWCSDKRRFGSDGNHFRKSIGELMWIIQHYPAGMAALSEIASAFGRLVHAASTTELEDPEREFTVIANDINSLITSIKLTPQAETDFVFRPVTPWKATHPFKVTNEPLLIVESDASFSSDPGKHSRGGGVFQIVGHEPNDIPSCTDTDLASIKKPMEYHKYRCSILCNFGKAIKRVCRSSTGTELIALSGNVSHGEQIRRLLIAVGLITERNGQIVITDSLNAGRLNPAEKSMRPDAELIATEKRAGRARIFHLPGALLSADLVTKRVVEAPLAMEHMAKRRHGLFPFKIEDLLYGKQEREFGIYGCKERKLALDTTNNESL